MSLERKADVSSLALEATLTAIKGTGWTTETLKAIYDAMALEATLTAIKGSGWSTETLKAIKDTIDALNNVAVTDILSDSTAFAGANIALIKTETDKIAAIKTESDQLPNWRFEDKLATTPATENQATASEANLTAQNVTPTFPTGATRQRVLLAAFLHASNQAANTHNIGLTLQIQKDGGGYVDVVDLTATVPISLVNVAGAVATFAIIVDVTATVDTSAVQYDFRWQVDSDNAGSINYTSNFVLTIIYSM